MPANENERRNLQQPTLEKPSLPDHDRTKDQGMHKAEPATLNQNEEIVNEELVKLEEETAPPDQEFEQLIEKGADTNAGRIPEDPNNWLTSDPEKGEYREDDPENRGESLPDDLDGIKH
jgi:hypothetical protein